MNRKGFLCYISSLRFLDLPSEAHCLLTGRQKSYGTLISGNFPQTTIRALQMPLCTADFSVGCSPYFRAGKGICSGISRAALFRYSLAAFYSGAHRPGVRTRISIFPKRKRRQSNYRLLWSLLGLFPEMRPAVYLAFFFIFFSLIVVVSPHSFRSVVTFGLFALCVLFTVKVPSIQIGSFLIAAVVIYRHFIKYLGEPLHIQLFKHTA